MKKNTVKILSFVLVLVLMPMAFSMTAAAAHIHNYIVQTIESEYGWVNDKEHSVTEIHVHTCSCGHTFMESHIKPNEGHTPAVGSEVYEGAYEGAGGVIYVTYRYTCVKCRNTYRNTVASKTIPASEEAESGEEAE